VPLLMATMPDKISPLIKSDGKVPYHRMAGTVLASNAPGLSPSPWPGVAPAFGAPPMLLRAGCPKGARGRLSKWARQGRNGVAIPCEGHRNDGPQGGCTPNNLPIRRVREARNLIPLCLRWMPSYGWIDAGILPAGGQNHENINNARSAFVGPEPEPGRQ
jgi:hypothetical protein